MSECSHGVIPIFYMFSFELSFHAHYLKHFLIHTRECSNHTVVTFKATTTLYVGVFTFYLKASAGCRMHERITDKKNPCQLLDQWDVPWSTSKCVLGSHV